MRTRQRGMTLLEVLLSVLVLAIGLFGAAGLQLRALQATEHARRDSQAVWLAHSALEQAREAGSWSAQQRGAWQRQLRDVLGEGARGEVTQSSGRLQVTVFASQARATDASLIRLQGRVMP